MKYFLYLFLFVLVLSSCDDNFNEVTIDNQKKEINPDNLALIAHENILNKEFQKQYIRQQNNSLSLSEDEKSKSLNSATNGLLIVEDLGKAYNNTGNDFYREGDFEYARFYYLLSLDFKLISGDNEGMALSYRNIALTYQSIGDYRNAAINFWQSYYLYEALEDTSQMAKLFNDLGIVYDLAHDFVDLEQFDIDNSQALSFYKKSINFGESLNNNKVVTQVENNIDLFYSTYLNKDIQQSSRTDIEVSRDQDDVEDEL